MIFRYSRTRLEWKRGALLVLIQFAILYGAFALLASHAAAQSAPQPSPLISDVRILTPQVARYEKFQAEFDIQTTATRLDLPYDPKPPPGLAPGEGITVDALFSNDNWKTTITQPAFLYQPFSHEDLNGRDHWTPDGAPRWSVRFAPQQTGDWQIRLRARDRDGETTSPIQDAFHFTVVPADGRYNGLRQFPSTRRGFLRVSARDPRYFEFQDGTPFLGNGYGASLDSVSEADAKLREFETNGIDFIRVWMSGSGINASQWTPWAFPNQSQPGGLPAPSLDPTTTFDGAPFSFRLDDKVKCLFADFWQGGIPVEPDTAYQVTAHVKLQDVQPDGSDPAAGFVIKQAPWLVNDCVKTNGIQITTPQVGTTDWITVTGTYKTTSNQSWLSYLYLTLQNTRGGQVFVDQVHVSRQDDPAHVELLRRPDPNSHLYFDSMNAAKWDWLIDDAAQHAVYLKIVIDEKNEWIRNRLDANGKLTAKADNNNFYATPNSEVRWLQQAWWRYLIARWGYSTAIHSFEYINEGDPYNGQHYDAANALATYFDDHDPAQHMVTTSFWSSFPNKEFWSNPQFSAVDYADIHAYLATGWGNTASFLPDKYVETRPEFVRTGNASARIDAKQNLSVPITPRGLVLNEPGEWIVRYWLKAQDLAANCGFGSTGSMVHVRWLLDGGAQNGGQAGFVPSNQKSQDFLCSSPAGTFDWKQFRSDQDRDGKVLPLQSRLVISDTLPHDLVLRIENGKGTGGQAWIDDVELVSPSGKVVPVIGQFDQTPFDDDTAWYNAAYGLLWGGASPVGAHKPLVRGETGIDYVGRQHWRDDLNQDNQGIWLHNWLWGQVNPGGMYELPWWGSETIEDNPKTGRRGNLFAVYLPYHNFLSDLPLNNGSYQDARAVTSDPDLRAWGQRDDKNGRAHLWIQNLEHTWKRVIADQAVKPLSGSITLPDMPAGIYHVEWWDTYSALEPILLTQTITVTNQLTLTLPEPLTTDIAVKITRLK